MGESFLAGAEYVESTQKEVILQKALSEVKGQRLMASLKNDEITVLVEVELEISAIIRRENRIETGHLTLDDVYFDLVNDAGLRIFFPLVQFQRVEQYGRSYNFLFDSYWWMLRPL